MIGHWIKMVEHAAAQRLPKSLVKSLQNFKQRLPIKLQQTPPVIQTYINDGVTRSFVGVHNFFSCLQPEVTTQAVVELAFYSPSGKLLLKHQRTLAHFGGETCDVAELFRQKGVSSPFGIVTVQMTPSHARDRIYRELGVVSAHFFVFFADEGSVAQVHPLSIADPAVAAGGPFLSSQVISTNGLTQIALFQYNPQRRPHSAEHQLLDARTRTIVARQRNTLAAMGAARINFDVAEISPLPEQLLLAMDDLPGPNAKPMLRRVFVSGLHSMSHS